MPVISPLAFFLGGGCFWLFFRENIDLLVGCGVIKKLASVVLVFLFCGLLAPMTTCVFKSPLRLLFWPFGDCYGHHKRRMRKFPPIVRCEKQSQKLVETCSEEEKYVVLLTF